MPRPILSILKGQGIGLVKHIAQARDYAETEVTPLPKAKVKSQMYPFYNGNDKYIGNKLDLESALHRTLRSRLFRFLTARQTWNRAVDNKNSSNGSHFALLLYIYRVSTLCALVFDDLPLRT